MLGFLTALKEAASSIVSKILQRDVAAPPATGGIRNAAKPAPNIVSNAKNSAVAQIKSSDQSQSCHDCKTENVEAQKASVAKIGKAISDSWKVEAVPGYPNYANCSGLVSSTSKALGVQGLAGKNAKDQMEFLKANSGKGKVWENLGTDHKLATQRAGEGYFVVAAQIGEGKAPIGSHVAIIIPGLTETGTDAAGYPVKANWPKAAWGRLGDFDQKTATQSGALRSSFASSDIDSGNVGYFAIPLPTN
jgi:hypothetical protein